MPFSSAELPRRRPRSEHFLAAQEVITVEFCIAPQQPRLEVSTPRPAIRDL